MSVLENNWNSFLIQFLMKENQTIQIILNGIVHTDNITNGNYDLTTTLKLTLGSSKGTFYFALLI